VRIAIFTEDTSNFIEQRELCSTFADHDAFSNERDENLPNDSLDDLRFFDSGKFYDPKDVGNSRARARENRDPADFRAELGHAVAT